MSATCKSCGRKIVWMTERSTGKKIPLDDVAPCYSATPDHEGQGLSTVNFTGERAPLARVTHFATCPQASSHSKSKKESTDAPKVTDPAPL